MMFLVAFAAGFAFGWFRAKRRGGDRLDKLQYGAGHGIAFTVALLALSILAARIIY